MDEMTLTLNSPLTDEQWDAITDVDFDNTNEIHFHTKHGKEVYFVKRKKGKWIENTEYFPTTYTCPFCGYKIYGETTNFCPSCGADLREE